MYSHMPFLFAGGMLLAAAPEATPGVPARWKLHVGHPSGGRRLETGLPDDVIECSPSLSTAPDGVSVVFVGQRDGAYGFYRMAGPGIDRLRPAEAVALCDLGGGHAGTASVHFEAVDRAELAGVEVRAFGQLRYLVPYSRLGLEIVARLTFEHGRPWRLLASGKAGGDWRTTLFDLKTAEAFRVRLADGKDVYKASVDGERMAYAARLSEAFEAREVRFAGPGEWRLEALDPEADEALRSTEQEVKVRRRRERCLRANCAGGRYCPLCRNQKRIRADLEDLKLVDRLGNGCPRGLAWDADGAVLDAVRPSGEAGAQPAVWCERFMVGTTPDQCQRCLALRAGGDADAAARWLQNLAARRRSMACAERGKTGRTRLRECCGRPEREAAVYSCARTGRDVEPADCAGCRDRVPPAAHDAIAEAVPC